MPTNTKVSSGEIQKSLAGVNYPADKQMLIKHAKDKNSNNDVISALNSLPDRAYTSSDDVSSELEIYMEEDE